MATNREQLLETLPVDAALLDSANRWFAISSHGLFWSGVVTALAAVVTGAFLFVQMRTGAIRENYSERRTATLELESTKAKAALEGAKAEIAKANAAAEEAKLEQERIRERLAWRRISMEQYHAFVESLRGKKVTLSFSNFAASDPEAATFASDLLKTLRDAGVTVTDVMSGTLYSSGPPPTGLQFFVMPNQETADLMKAFHDAKIAPLMTVVLRPDTTAIRIVLGSRPAPF